MLLGVFVAVPPLIAASFGAINVRPSERRIPAAFVVRAAAESDLTDGALLGEDAIEADCAVLVELRV